MRYHDQLPRKLLEAPLLVFDLHRETEAKSRKPTVRPQGKAQVSFSIQIYASHVMGSDLTCVTDYSQPVYLLSTAVGLLESSPHFPNETETGQDSTQRFRSCQGMESKQDSHLDYPYRRRF